MKIFSRNNYLRLVILTTFMLFVNNDLFARTATWDGGGGSLVWTTAANWDTDVAPVAGDDIVFNTAGTYTITAVPTLAINSLTITSGTVTFSGATTTLTIGGNAGTDFTIAASQALTISGTGAILNITMAASATSSISGTFTISSGATWTTSNASTVMTVNSGGTISNAGTMTGATTAKLIFEGTSYYYHAQNGGTVPTADWNGATGTGTSVCYITGVTSTMPSGITGGVGFYDFYWNCTSQSSQCSFDGTYTLCSNNFTVASTNATSILITSGGTDVVTVSGNYIQTGGKVYVGSSGSGIASGLTVTGNVTFSGGTIVINSGNGSLSGGNAKLIVGGNYTQTVGTLNFCDDGSAGYGSYLYVTGNISQTSGSMTVTTSGGSGIYCQASGSQTASISSTLTGINMTVMSGSTTTLTANLGIGASSTLTVSSGGTLATDTYVISGSGTTTISSGAYLQTAHTGGLMASASSGAIQTTTRTYNTGAYYTFNGTSAQITGDFQSTVAGLTLNNSNGVTFSQSITVSNAGTLTLTAGYHDLKSYTLTMGTTASANTLTYTAGGLYSSTDNGTFKRYIPSGITMNATAATYGLYPFAKSSQALGTVKFTTSAALTTGGYISIVPTFNGDNSVSCSVADGGNTVVLAQTGKTFALTVNSLVGGTNLTMEYDCGTLVDPSGSASDLCLAAWNGGTSIAVYGTHSANTGSKTSPQLIRTTTASSWATLTGHTYCMGSYSTSSTVGFTCSKTGAYTVGPTGTYSTLTAAVLDLSTYGLAGSVTFNLQATYVSTSETFPIVLSDFNCLSASNTLTIRPADGATGLSISGASSDAIITFEKGNYIYLYGSTSAAPTTSQLTIENTNTTGSVVKFINDAHHNSLTYCTLSGSSTSTGTILFSTTTQTVYGNSNNTISNNTIQNYTGNTQIYGIYSLGTATYTNSTNTISSNNFKNFTTYGIFVSTNSDAWTISSNSFYQSTSQTPTADVAAIYVSNTGSGYTISSNNIGGQAASCGADGSPFTLASSAYTFTGIYLSSGTSATNSIQGNTIKNITLNSTVGTASGAGIFSGIYVAATGTINIGTTTANNIGNLTAAGASTNNSSGILVISTTSGGWIIGIGVVTTSGTATIQQNNIGCIGTSNVSAKGYVFYGIKTSGSGTIVIGGSSLANTIGSTSVASSIVIGGGSTATGVCKFYGIDNSSSGIATIDYNNIYNVSVYGTGASLLYGINNTAGTDASEIAYNTLNTLSLSSSGSTGNFYGIYQSAVITISVSYNTITAITITNATIVRGLAFVYGSSSSKTVTVTGNTFGTSGATISVTPSSSINTAGQFCGIYVSSSGNTLNFTSNLISYISGVLSGTNQYTIEGIYVGAGAPSLNFTSNTIQNISNKSTQTGTTGAVYGMNITTISTTSSTFKKNMILNLSMEGDGSLDGIDVARANAGTINFINNFISMKNYDGTSTYTNRINMKCLGISTSSATPVNNIYYNTFEIGGNAGATTSRTTYCLYITGAGVAITTTGYNNIMINARTSGAAEHYVIYTHTSTTSTFDYNYYVNPNTTTYAKVLTTAKTNATFNASGNGYGGTNSTYSTTSSDLTVASDGAPTVSVGSITGITDLYSTDSDCREDINGNTTARSTNPQTSGTSHMGCYESGITTYYSKTSTSNTAAQTLTNWTSNTAGTGSTPSAFTTAGITYVIQSGHQYKVTGAWTGSATSVIQVNSGGALDLNAQTISTFLRYDIAGTGVSSSGALYNSSTSASSTSIPVTLTADATITSSGTGGLTLTGNITNAGYVLTVNGSESTTISTGVISGTGSLTKSGAGALTLSGTNTYSGNTTLSAGTLNLSNDAAIGTSTLYIAGGTIDATTADRTITNAMSIGASFTFTGTNNLTQGTGAIALTASPTITTSANTLLLGGIVSGAQSITKAGSGTLTLSGTNTYSGGTTLSAGTIKLGNDAALGSGTFTISGGTVDAITAARSITNAMSIGASFTFTGTQNLTQGTGTVALTASPTITTSANTLAIGGVISGAYTLTKAGAGTLQLTGNNTFSSGTTLNAGTLNIGHDAALGTGTFTISGGTVDAITAARSITNAMSIGASFTFTGTQNLTQSTGTVALTASPTITTIANTLAIGGVISGAYTLTKAGAGTLTLSGNNTYSSGTTLNAGTINIGHDAALGTGTFTISGGTVDAITSAKSITNAMSIGASFVFTGTQNLTQGTGTITLTASPTITANANTLTLGGVVSGAQAITKAGAGALTLSGNNTYSSGTTLNAGTLNIGHDAALGTGTFTISGGTVDAITSAKSITNALSIGASFVFTGTQNLTQGTGTVTLTSTPTITTSANTFTIGGITSGGFGITKAGSGTMVLSGANDYTGAVTVNAGVLNIRHATATGTTAGGVTVASGAALEMQGGITVGAEALTLNNDGVSSAGSLRNVSGANTWGGAITLSSNATRINSDAGTLTLSGTISNGAINLTFGGAGDIAANGVIGNGAGNLVKDGAGQLTLGATNTYSGTTTLTLGTMLLGAAQTSLTNDIVLTAGTLNAAGFAITTSGNWTNNGATFTHGNNTVTLSGASKTIGGSTSTTFYNLTNTGATSLGVATTVNNTMTLGNHLTLSTYDLTIGSSGVFSGYDNTKFVVTNSTGKVTQNGLGAGAAAGKQIFPIGYSSATTDYTPCVMNNTGTTDNLSVYVSSGRLASGTSGAAATTHAVDRSWHVSEAVNGGSTVAMTLQWDVARELTSFTRTNCHIGHYNGASWDASPGESSATNVSGTIYEVSRTSISSFSPFDVEDPSALPITLIDFKAKQEGKRVRLDWETGTEENNDYFTIERSLDGVNFEKVFTKDGAGNSKTNLYYFGYDNNPYAGISYYRLKQTDFDGKFAYSEIQSVNIPSVDVEDNKPEFSVYPNPAVENTFHIDFTADKSETYFISLYDDLGKLIHFETLESEKGKNTTIIKIPSVSTGMYLLEIRSESIGVENRYVKF